uniref:CRAL-TRIO domain-containing protein n=1 Tax=Cuerna arida TaxID=1464854 RepID=A0A1B6EXZ6_9HEMI
MFKVTLEDEFKKNPELKAEDIEDVKAWLKSQPHLPPVPDLVIVLFLQACQWDLDLTKKTIDIYYTCRTEYTEFFADRDPLSQEIQDIAKTHHVVYLPQRDPEGNQIIVTRTVDPDIKNYNFAALVKYYTMSTEAFQLENGTVPGIVMVCDVDNFKASHFWCVPFKQAKNNMRYSQEAASFHIKAVHHINIHPLIHKMLQILKPLLKAEVIELIKMHSSIETLFQSVPKEIMPKDYGGEAPTMEELNELNLQRIQKYQQYFKDEQKVVVDESKRISKKAKQSEDPEEEKGWWLLKKLSFK